MSRQNKVNPGTYTQRGRLTQDDAARELRKQSAFESPHTWQPVNTKTRQRLAPGGHGAREIERTADDETMVQTSPQVERRPASRVRNTTATKAAPSTAKAKAVTAKTASTRKSKSTTGKAKTGKVMTTATKRTATKPRRKAVLARNAGGGGSAPQPATKRRKS